ncbi:MAG: hypothetical protein RI935_447 [Candidatus Parcubacteria bacterium]|jgi:hypothetical protein
MYKNSLPQVHVDIQPHLVKEGVFLIDQEVWSTQKRIARIYGKSVPTINDHLKKIFADKELVKPLNEREIVVTQLEGKKKVSRTTLVYSTDVLISIGFRVNGEWGKEFRIWARDIVRKSYDPKSHVEPLIKKPKVGN